MAYRNIAFAIERLIDKYFRNPNDHKCRWWNFHVWSKWETTHKGTVKGYPAKIQECECQRCGMICSRIVKSKK